MRHTLFAERALRLAADNSRSQYVCQQCLIKAHSRGLRTSSPRLAEKPFYQRMREAFGGKKDEEESKKQRAEAKESKIERVQKGEEVIPETVEIEGKAYQVAALVDTKTDPQYSPAASWKGLESIGSENWVKARADQGEQYIPYVDSKKTINTSTQGWRHILHNITVELLTLQKNNRKLSDIMLPRREGIKDRAWLVTRKATMQYDEGSRALEVIYRRPEHEQAILRAIPEEETLPLTEQTASESNHEVTSPEARGSKKGALSPNYDANNDRFRLIADQGWFPNNDGGLVAGLDLPLNDPAVRFAISKRVLQLSGRRLPDPILSKASDLNALSVAFANDKVKPKKLKETPQLQRLMTSAPNIAVYSRRQTPIDKEKSVGRWKIIREELIRRDLPVTGTRYKDMKLNS